MSAIKAHIKGNRLFLELEINDTEDAPLSKSGKTRIAASTQGFVEIPGTKCKMSMNITRPL